MRSIWIACFFAFVAVLGPAAPAGCQEIRFFDGLIEPSGMTDLSSQVQGTLKEIAVERGDTVNRGQVVARLHQDIEMAAVDLARARKEFVERKVLRNEELHRKNLLSVHDRDEMETELQIAELQLREAQEKLDVRTIRSPIGGIVVERYRSPGEYVGEEPIVRIARIQPLYVELVVPVEAFGLIRKGMRALVRPELAGTGKVQARVVIVDSVVDAASGTFGVRLEMPNPGGSIPPGLKCRVFFPELKSRESGSAG